MKQAHNLAIIARMGPEAVLMYLLEKKDKKRLLKWHVDCWGEEDNVSFEEHAMAP